MGQIKILTQMKSQRILKVIRIHPQNMSVWTDPDEDL